MKTIMALLLVFVFMSSEIAWAEVIDLRDEGDIAVTDVLLGVVAGYTQAMAIKPNWSVWRVFASTYLVPVAADKLTKALDIKNPILAGAFRMGLSVGVNTGLDVATTGKEIAKGATGNLAQRSQGVLGRFWNKIKGVFGRGKEAAQPAAPAATGISEVTASARRVSPWTAVAYKTVQGAGYGAARAGIYQTLKKSNQALADFLASTGSMLSAQYLGRYLSKATGVVFSVAKDKEGVGIGIMAEKLEGEALNNRLAQENKLFWREFGMVIIGKGVETFAASQGLKEEGILFSAGITSMLRQNQLAKEKQTYEREKAEIEEKLKVLEQVKTQGSPSDESQIAHLKDLKVIDAEGNIDAQRLDLMLDIRKLQIKQKDYLIQQSSRGILSAMIEGLKTGGISIGLQKISLKTKSPIHGAYFNLFASSLLRSAFISNKNIFKVPADTDLENMDTAILANLVRYHKDYSFYAAGVGASATEALADMMSMGRARPYLTENGTFGLDWQRTNDVFFMDRYDDYTRDLDKHNFTSALASQFISSLHYQAVSNVRDIVNHSLYRLNLAKTSPLNNPYLYLSRGVTCQQISADSYRTGLPVSDTRYGREIQVAKQKDLAPLGFGSADDNLKRIRNEVASNKGYATGQEELTPEQEEKLVSAIDNYLSTKKIAIEFSSPTSRWKILEVDGPGKTELAKDRIFYESEFYDGGPYGNVVGREVARLKEKILPEITEIITEKAAEAATEAGIEATSEIAQFRGTVIRGTDIKDPLARNDQKRLEKLYKATYDKVYNEELQNSEDHISEDHISTEIWNIIQKREPIRSNPLRDLVGVNRTYYDKWQKKKSEQKSETIDIENAQAGVY